MQTDLLIYAIIAAVLVVWLRNVLGTRNGDEQQRPNPYLDVAEKSENVVGIDGQPFAGKEEGGIQSLDVSKDVAAGLEQLSRAMRDFDPADFVSKTKDAFIFVVQAFAEGDKDTLKVLLAPSVYDSFSSVIDERVEKGETVSTEIHAVRKADIIEAVEREGVAYVSVRFTADETCVIRDKDDKILSGDPDRITEMVDVWVFGRSLKSKDPVWKVYETRDDEVEDHKTPIPETSE